MRREKNKFEKGVKIKKGRMKKEKRGEEDMINETGVTTAPETSSLWIRV